MVVFEETQPQVEEGQNLSSMSKGNEAQVLFVLLLTMRNIIDNIIFDHPRFYKEAISGPYGEVFRKILEDVERTDDKVSEYCLFVLRSDNPEEVLSEYSKASVAINNIFKKIITATGFDEKEN